MLENATVEAVRNNALPYRTVARWAAAFQRHAVLVESNRFCTTLALQVSFHHPLCHNIELTALVWSVYVQ